MNGCGLHRRETAAVLCARERTGESQVVLEACGDTHDTAARRCKSAVGVAESEDLGSHGQSGRSTSTTNVWRQEDDESSA
jgi:hypothetical protein